MLTRTISASLLTAALFWLVPISAEEPVRRNEVSGDIWLLAKYDVDGDQVISSDEISTKRETMFGYMDRNSDSSVTFDEYQALDTRKRALLLRARFEKLDLDRDGQLEIEEYSSYLGSFDRFDQNGDGRVTLSEMALDASQKAPKSNADNTHCLLWLCVKTSLD